VIPRLSQLILIVCLALVSPPDDFKTLSGKEDKSATVSRQEPDGIIVSNAKSGVMAKLYFTELPKEVQERFGYNPEAATAYQRQRNAVQQAQLQQQGSPQQKTEAEQRTDTLGFLTAGARGNSRYGGGNGSVLVDGYYRKDGTYVHSYNRAAPGTVPHSSSEASYGTPTYSSGVARDGGLPSIPGG